MTTHDEIAGRIADATPNSPTPLFPSPLLPVWASVVCGVSGSDQIQSDRHLGRIGFGDLR